MSKIIIHNKSMHSDWVAARMVANVIGKGFVSGDSQYCWVTHYPNHKIRIIAKKTRGTTHAFEVRDYE